MARPFRTPSKREIITANNATHRFYAGASDRPDAQANLDKLVVQLAPKRERVKRPVDGKPAVPLEAEVVRAVSELLAYHPRVLFAVRQNSGAASYETASGKFAPVWFYHVLTGQPVTITDFWGLLRDGRPFAIEAKREGWKEPSTHRERKQWAFLALVRNCGGCGGFARNVEEAQAILA